jgi:acyl carrier protein
MNDQREPVRAFVIEWLDELARGRGTRLPALSNETDLLGTGIIDSMDFVDLITAVEERFSCEVNFGTMDVKVFTTVGGLVTAASTEMLNVEC